MDGTDFLSKLEYYKENFKKPLVVEGGVLNFVAYENGESVAQVAYWQEYGTKYTPPRPFMRPTMTDNQTKYSRLVEQWIADGVSRDEIGDRLALTLAGDIKESISNVHEPALTKGTLYKRRKKGNSSVKPLVDTGILIGSISGSYK